MNQRSESSLGGLSGSKIGRCGNHGKSSIFRALLLMVLFVILLLDPLYALTASDAQKAIQGIAPGAKVLSVERSPVEGLWEVVVEFRGRKSILYMDEKMKNVVLGSIVDLQSRRNLTKEKFDEINRVDVSQIPLDDAIVMGDAMAPKRVIVFDDPD